jgi:Amidohydrolase
VPERLVWGSDWPHPGVRDPEPKPDDAILIDLMLDWAPDEVVRNRIFVDNAAKLYDFSKSMRLSSASVTVVSTTTTARALGPNATSASSVGAFSVP